MILYTGEGLKISAAKTDKPKFRRGKNMDSELKDILDRGIAVIYDGEGYLKRIEWRELLEDKLRSYFERDLKQRSDV